MHCYVYKGDKKEHHYLYLETELEDADVPDSLLSIMGELQLIIEFELHAQRQLPQADPKQVLQDIQDKGFYLQMPKKDMRAEEDRLFS